MSLNTMLLGLCIAAPTSVCVKYSLPLGMADISFFANNQYVDTVQLSISDFDIYQY